MSRDSTLMRSSFSWLMGCALFWVLAGVGVVQAATVEKERLERLEQKTLSTSPGAKPRDRKYGLFSWRRCLGNE